MRSSLALDLALGTELIGERMVDVHDNNMSLLFIDLRVSGKWIFSYDLACDKVWKLYIKGEK